MCRISSDVPKAKGVLKAEKSGQKPKEQKKVTFQKKSAKVVKPVVIVKDAPSLIKYLHESMNLDEGKKSPNLEETEEYGQVHQSKKPLNWKEKQNWVEKRFKDLELSEAMNMSEMFRNQLESKNSSSNSKIINWMIKNMPDGKQTIIVL